ncbi:MAG: extracellular solute-binding protein [Spirochaetia bacterium]|jgi:raffinose/stachyose/melibiose transport system substrate-binding protein|nr:extracellular solute-binding protein [Spirochaetia bacterium]
MKKSKLSLVLLLVSLVSVGLFANGTGETETEGTGTAAAATDANAVTLNILDYSDATAPGYEKTKAVWQKFDDENPGIVLKKEDLTNEAFHQKMAAYVAAGTIPDVMYMYPSGRSAVLHEKHLVKDLAPLLGPDFLSHFLPSVTDPTDQTSGYLAELPQSICYSSVMYVNTKLLKDNGLAVPTTYAELRAMVPRLKAKGIQTVLMANKDDWVMQSCLFSTIAGRFVDKQWVNDAKQGKVKFTDPQFVKALDFVKQLYDDGVISKSTLQLAYGEAPGLFASGKAAILIDGDWKQSSFVTDQTTGQALISPEDQKNNIELKAFPAIPGEKYPGVVSSTLGCGYGISAAIPAGSAKEKAAVELLKYIYSEPVQKHYLERGRYITSRIGVTSDKLDPLTLKMMDYYSTIKNTSYVFDSALDPSVYTVMNKVLQEIGLGTKTPQQAAQEIQAAMDAYLASK